VTTQDHSSAELSTLVGGLLTVGSLLTVAMAVMISPWLVPVAGVALLALGWIALRMRVPRVLALVTIAFGLVLLTLAISAFLAA
jgi:hypothetical protein